MRTVLTTFLQLSRTRITMADFANSSLSVWLNWGGVLPAVIHLCQSVRYSNGVPSFNNASCAQVCNDTVSLFDSRTHNLETCGLWLTSLVNPVPPGSSNSVDFLPKFSSVGLNTSAYQYNITYADAISSCLVDFGFRVKLGSVSAGTVSSGCTNTLLFPFSTTASLNTGGFQDFDDWMSSSALKACLNDICSPRRLSPDLVGIGVLLTCT